MEMYLIGNLFTSCICIKGKKSIYEYPYARTYAYKDFAICCFDINIKKLPLPFKGFHSKTSFEFNDDM